MSSRPHGPGPGIRLEDVTVRFPRGDALRGVSLAVPAGEFAVVTGPNGAGKSTLLEVVAGVCPPTRGRRRVHGSLAFVPQRAAVPAGLPLTAQDVVEVGTWGRLGALRRRDRRAREAVGAAMDRVAVRTLARHPFAALSGGQQQRVLLAQGLASCADVLLVDEPTTALDAESVARIRGVLRDEARRGAVVLCVTHDAALIQDAHREIALRDGVLVRHSVEQGSPQGVGSETVPHVEVGERRDVDVSEC
ncbi:metal ABC transporter ATP-binding protein [Microbacterium sp. BLY]|uniref:metal ABC transporter ATP-binding protein n=1 Tax=Microbacterium sp. BLY TaxID=2823280 RepID=UPI001B333BBB|nr:ATP-binding cassette domain-containing protein [Microbacterium sp. BLY]MBP3976365.1 ATP-binding cassette domain-containing protein [Microbacterium sp. BLY]